ncbi:MAG: 4-hydroxy-3-methylbut-2-enyl diphosphate reductase [Desulfohalobiaceae bacterium]|nr:4-hydroxy-3-methylbut-2-enyl diphosphate reductase [Desulfohalobiaceae bacterium]
MPKVLRAATAGFCMGVDLALKKLERLLSEQAEAAADIYTLGPIIHNPQVLAMYAAKGVGRLEDPESASPGSSIVIRAHGVPRHVRRTLRRKGVYLVDATCPKVKKAQKLIETYTGERNLLLYGEPDHPEVVGLLSYAQSETMVFQELSELSGCLEQGKRYVLAAQTTQDRSEYTRIYEDLRARLGGELPVLDTICDTTRQRQQEASDIADQVELMIVVGGRSSGNTRRLAQVAASHGKPCVHVEEAEELPLERIRACRVVGLTAGASTPGHVIDEVERKVAGLEE